MFILHFEKQTISGFHFFLLVLDSVKPQIKSWFRSPLRLTQQYQRYNGNSKAYIKTP
jgi:hypothetical protein